MKKAWEKVPDFLKNKYAICIIAFVVWLAFFDKNDFYAQYRPSFLTETCPALADS